MRDSSWWSFFISFVVTLAVLFGLSIYVPKALKEKHMKVRKLEKLYLYFTDKKGESLYEVVTYDKPVDGRVDFLFEKLKNPPPGYGSPLPKGTRLLSWRKEGNTLILNFSKELVENHPGGASAEAATVYGIVNTFVKNLKGVDMVEIEVEGKKLDTLKGHVYIGKPIKFTGDVL